MLKSILCGLVLLFLGAGRAGAQMTGCVEVNGVCSAGENYLNCPEDCPAVCGNGDCEGNYGERPSNCREDCPICGDAKCGPGEAESCPGDCSLWCPPIDCSNQCGIVDNGCKQVDCGDCSCSPTTPAFWFSPSNPVAGDAVTFRAEPSTVSDEARTWWTFGDGATAKGSPAEYSYSSAGVYDVVLTAKEPSCGLVMKTDPVQINVALPPPPAPCVPGPDGWCGIAISAGGPYSGFSDEPLQLSSTVSGANGGPTYLWSFGDGTTSYDASPIHTYTSPGIYKVVLTVTVYGRTETAVAVATIAKKQVPGALLNCDYCVPTVRLIYDAAQRQLNATVRLEILSTNNNIEWRSYEVVMEAEIENPALRGKWCCPKPIAA